LTITANNSSRQQPRESMKDAIGFRFLLAGVIPSLRTIHGQFQRERLRLLGLFADAPRILTKPRCLMTVRMEVFFNRTLSRLSSNEVGTASSTRNARESATATCEAEAPRRVRLISLTPSKTPKVGGLNPPKHRQSQLVGSSELEMQPQPFVHSQSHSPAPHFAILHPRKRSVRIDSIDQVTRQSQVLSGPPLSFCRAINLIAMPILGV
jgi:hypothetical protein